MSDHCGKTAADHIMMRTCIQ